MGTSLQVLGGSVGGESVGSAGAGIRPGWEAVCTLY